MSERLSHLVFYDGNCGLCDRIVQFLYKEDKNQLFVFAPLQGETASQYLKKLPPELRFTDSLILIENYRSSDPRVSILAKGALRIAWLLRWPWTLIGWLSFFPGWMFDWIYRLVAANRQVFFPIDQCFVPPPNQKDRFLP
jgi:predicted DCC family thiol-disulfide oxidoreductase YuxK